MHILEFDCVNLPQALWQGKASKAWVSRKAR
jgi:hypothetical protein